VETVAPVGDLLAAGDCTPQCLLALEPDGLCACRCRGQWHGRLSEASVAPSNDPIRIPTRRKPIRTPTRSVEALGQEWVKQPVRDAEKESPCADVVPEWGWWPDDGWWRTWWRLVREWIGEGEWGTPQVLEMIAPEYSATEAFANILAEQRSGADAWPITWIQRDLRRDGYVSWSAHCDATFCRLERFNPTLGSQKAFLSALKSADRCDTISPGEQATAFGFGNSTEAMAAAEILDATIWGRHPPRVTACIEALKGQ
jgi:hypothetical protein